MSKKLTRTPATVAAIAGLAASFAVVPHVVAEETPEDNTVAVDCTLTENAEKPECANPAGTEEADDQVVDTETPGTDETEKPETPETDPNQGGTDPEAPDTGDGDTEPNPDENGEGGETTNPDENGGSEGGDTDPEENGGTEEPGDGNEGDGTTDPDKGDETGGDNTDNNDNEKPGKDDGGKKLSPAAIGGIVAGVVGLLGLIGGGLVLTGAASGLFAQVISWLTATFPWLASFL